MVDGEPLSDRLGRGAVPPLGWLLPEYEKLAASSFLASDLDEPARVAIFVCPECGDAECGYVSAIVERSGDEIIWRDFASSWHDHFPEPGEGGAGSLWKHETESYPSTIEFRFDAAEYRLAIVNRPFTVGDTD
jgi:hypothetical protein